MRRLAVGLVLFTSLTAVAQEGLFAGRRASRPERRDWDFALTAYPTQPRGGDTITSAIGAADAGELHLEARYGYEQKDSRSAFAGWTFSGGETVKWELTPIAGYGWGTPQSSFIPGFEATFTWGRFDAYVEAEFVRHRDARENDFNYAWSELGFHATQKLRLGAVFQRTRAYGEDRHTVLGPFVQFAWERFTLGAYWFDPGAATQVFVGAVGFSF
jgi:hypothetical protein